MRMIGLNQVIAVTKEQYEAIKTKYPGYVMHRQDKGWYFIKIVCPGKTKEINQALGYE